MIWSGYTREVEDGAVSRDAKVDFCVCRSSKLLRCCDHTLASVDRRGGGYFSIRGSASNVPVPIDGVKTLSQWYELGESIRTSDISCSDCLLGHLTTEGR